MNAAFPAPRRLDVRAVRDAAWAVTRSWTTLIARLDRRHPTLRSATSPGAGARRGAVPLAGMGPARVDAGALRRAKGRPSSLSGTTRPIRSDGACRRMISTVCVFDTRSGHLLGLIDGTFLTAMRTGAASAVASRSWRCRTAARSASSAAERRPSPRSTRLSRAFPIEKIIAYDIKRRGGRGRWPTGPAFLTAAGDVVRTRVARPISSRAPTSSAPALRRAGRRAGVSGCRRASRTSTSTPSARISTASSSCPSSSCGAASCAPTSASRRSTKANASSSHAAEIGPDLEDARSAPGRLRRPRNVVRRSSIPRAGRSRITSAALMLFDYARELGVGRSVRLRVPSSGSEGSVLAARSPR